MSKIGIRNHGESAGGLAPSATRDSRRGFSSFKGITPENCVQVRKCAPQRSIDRSILRPVTIIGESPQEPEI